MNTDKTNLPGNDDTRKNDDVIVFTEVANGNKILIIGRIGSDERICLSKDKAMALAKIIDCQSRSL